MKATILLNYNENTKQVEEEERERFLKDVLEQVGVPLDFWNTEGVLTPSQKNQLRGILSTLRIQIIDDLDGCLQIYYLDEESEDTVLVGEWYKPTYKLKRDLRQLDPKKQLYLEMEIDCYTMFEDQPQE